MVFLGLLLSFNLSCDLNFFLTSTVTFEVDAPGSFSVSFSIVSMESSKAVGLTLCFVPRIV